MISVRASDFARTAPRRVPAPLGALPVTEVERSALERFIALEAGTDHDAYLDACKAACKASPAAFNILCDVTLRRLPLRTYSGVELLQAATHELVMFFAAIDKPIAA